jgi:chaperonin GroEL (HSP60 family)
LKALEKLVEKLKENLYKLSKEDMKTFKKLSEEDNMHLSEDIYEAIEKLNQEEKNDLKY